MEREDVGTRRENFVACGRILCACAKEGVGEARGI
jgi:hypothetical protein